MLAEEIKKFFKDEVMDGPEDRALYSRDASIFEVVPEVIVAPKDVEDIKNLVKFVASEKKKGRRISLTARSAGTDMSGGALGESIVVDFTKHMNRLLTIDKTHAVAEPGMFYRDFEKETDKLGAMMPSYPASKNLCALGGMVSNNSGGEKTLAYGKTEDYVEELKVILDDGEEYDFKEITAVELEYKLKLKNAEGDLYRKIFKLIDDNYEALQKAKPNVSKNSAGYYLWNVWDKKHFNLNKLIVGSQGTLGFVTQIRFRLVPKYNVAKLAAIFLNDLEYLPDIIKEVLKFKPESFEAYDDKTLKLAIRFMPSLLKNLKWKAFKLGWEFLPEFWMVITGGLPKLILLAELTGDSEDEVNYNLSQLNKVLAERFPVKIRLTKNKEESEKYWIVRRESFNLLRSHVKDRQTAPFIDDIIVRPEYLPEFLPKLNAILDKYGDKMISTIAGHAGDGNFHVIPLMKLTEASSRAIIPEVAKQVYDLVLSLHGSITAEHNDGLIRSPFLMQMYGEKIYHLFEKTKDIFDPLGIFNPGKKVHSDLNYALAHIKAKK
jgi:FAD/FMN-containing dehydrogenase